MIRVTIVKDDDTMLIDGAYQRVDCSDLPANFHALQWNNGYGEIEWKTTPGSSRPPNTVIDSLTPYQKYIDRWHAEKVRRDAEIAAFIAAQEALIANNAAAAANTA